jgi:hypothetical protein
MICKDFFPFNASQTLLQYVQDFLELPFEVRMMPVSFAAAGRDFQGDDGWVKFIFDSNDILCIVRQLLGYADGYGGEVLEGREDMYGTIYTYNPSRNFNGR